MRCGHLLMLTAAVAVGSTSTGCALSSTEITLTDPRAASLWVVEDGKRTQVLAPERDMPPPPLGSVAHAIWESHDMTYYRAKRFDIERVPDHPRGEGQAFRFSRGGISIAYARVPRVSEGLVPVLDDSGVLHFGDVHGGYRGRTFRIDSSRCVVIISQRLFSSPNRKAPRVGVADIELEVPLSAVRSIRLIRDPLLSSRQVTAIYPPHPAGLLR